MTKTPVDSPDFWSGYRNRRDREHYGQRPFPSPGLAIAMSIMFWPLTAGLAVFVYRALS